MADQIADWGENEQKLTDRVCVKVDLVVNSHLERMLSRGEAVEVGPGRFKAV